MKNEFNNIHFTLKEVKKGIYAAISKPGGGAVANAGFVDLGDGVIVFDTFNTQQASKALRDAAERITNQSVTWVVNSHYHGDHVRGNQTFKGTSILSSETTFEKMKEIHPPRIEKQKADIDGLTQYIESLEKQLDESGEATLQDQVSFLHEMKRSLPELELTLPNETFKEDKTIQGTRRSATLFTLGGGHSFCDSMLYLPEEKVIFMGDLVFVHCHPTFFDETDPRKWMDILRKVKKLDIETVIPGHGDIGTKEDIDIMILYLTHLLSVQHKESAEIPPLYKNWASPEVYFQNIKNVKSKKGTSVHE
ncbi:MBL fold metallo-hydrolase [Rossellomorea vietnamensis]|uniref:MBL fold metallo-hydrolase n=1 Tax=Rossellomorea vietnamensis TaxID=218284 RepID=A0ACD4CDS5_9BACI|nr:MBL fold metallo-hydrolase [Rossellomorea vietnamensis]UXH46607.1 MBL fold metallo-hydrolase [Rossellomorea vietnamensis]